MPLMKFQISVASGLVISRKLLLNNPKGKPQLLQ